MIKKHLDPKIDYFVSHKWNGIEILKHKKTGLYYGLYGDNNNNIETGYACGMKAATDFVNGVIIND